MICQMFIALRGEGGRSEREGADLLGKRQAGDLTRRRFKAYELNAAALTFRSIGGRRRGRAFIRLRNQLRLRIISRLHYRLSNRPRRKTLQRMRARSLASLRLRFDSLFSRLSNFARGMRLDRVDR